MSRAADDLKPWGRAPYCVGGMTFTSLTALGQAISARRDQHDLEVEFEDALIADVINKFHPDVVQSGQQAVKFRKRSMDSLPSAIRWQCPSTWRFEAYFLPLGRWQDVTAYPWRKGTLVADLKNALRAIFREYVRPKLADACAICGTAEALDYDHVDPSFGEIANECLTLMSEDEIKTKFGYDQFHPTKMSLAAFIPLDHPAVVHLIATHRHPAFQWQWLCRLHHQQVTSARRRAQRDRERPH